MPRRIALLLALALPAATPAQPPRPAPTRIDVAAGVHLFQTAPYSDVGLDGNAVVIVSDDGVLVFDSNGTPAAAEAVLGRRVPCLYGGSVNPENCQELIARPHVDGLFIGRSAWDAGGYLDILAKCAATL